MVCMGLVFEGDIRSFIAEKNEVVFFEMPFSYLPTQFVIVPIIITLRPSRQDKVQGTSRNRPSQTDCQMDTDRRLPH